MRAIKAIASALRRLVKRPKCKRTKHPLTILDQGDFARADYGQGFEPIQFVKEKSDDE